MNRDRYIKTHTETHIHGDTQRQDHRHMQTLDIETYIQRQLDTNIETHTKTQTSGTNVSCRNINTRHT